MKSNKMLTRILPRDGHLCGVHFGGCGKPIRNRTDATVDHIFTKSFFKDRVDSVRPAHYNKDWNCQPMHQKCNGSRGGQIYGFPLFTCPCHWLQIVRTDKGHILNLHHGRRVGGGVFTVVTEEHSFVFNNLSTGAFSAQLGGLSEIEIGSLWSMGNVKPGKKGIVGKGQLGHAFPRIAPEEVRLFNQLEIKRIEEGSSETIEKFNRRMDTMSMAVHFEVLEEPTGTTQSV